jgi:hypothetical protein
MKLFMPGECRQAIFPQLSYQTNTEKSSFFRFCEDLSAILRSFWDHKFPAAFAKQISEGSLLFKQHMLL